ncbi:MAG: serine/threonine protein kinase [Gammaproteobacteria bacterium]|nr:serine/threonine protein kinase [Gammaproteobacteria bacterium]
MIGKGGMGAVYGARDLRKEEAQDRDPYVAIKVLGDEFRQHPDSLKALQREARKSQQLAHPNIITVFDFDRDGTTVFMTMELLKGQPLDKIIGLHPQGLPRKQALRIAEQMAKGLAYAHEKHIVHSDFKPGNVFLEPDGRTKVLDFGIARAVPSRSFAAGATTVFDAGQLGALTPSYASREMLNGELPAPSDDVYALAIVVYELLTGVHPFNRKHANQAKLEGLRPRHVKGLKRRQ